jgi:MscS family membrane protein
MELWAYIKTGDWAQFTGIRQDVILKIVEIIEAAGTHLAAPTRLTYLSGDVRINAEKDDRIVQRTQEFRDGEASRLPDEART